MTEKEYESRLYHRMCDKLWTVVKADGESDCTPHFTITNGNVSLS